MIRLAANYSQPLLALMGKHPHIVDAVKMSEFDRPEYISGYGALAARGVPLVLHGLGQNVTPGTPAFRSSLSPEKLAIAIRVSKPAYLSLHLEWRCPEPFPGEDAFLTALARDVARIRELSGLPVHLEIVPHYRKISPEPNNNPALISDPEFIHRAVELTGSSFLLDICHAQVAAWHRGESAEEYIGRLPLAAVEEIHMAGPVFIDGMLRDRHLEVAEDGYALLATTLRRCAAAMTPPTSEPGQAKNAHPLLRMGVRRYLYGGT